MSANVIAMVADIMATQLQMMMANVVAMVVDVMTTQSMCAIWQMLKPIVVDAITTGQDIFLVQCLDIQQNLILYMWYICGCYKQVL